MIPEDYGTIIATTKLDNLTRYIVTNKEKRLYQIDMSEDSMVNIVTILGPANLERTDTKLIEGFKREIGKSTVYFVDGESVLVKQQRPAKPFSSRSEDKHLIKKFVTIDIETITDSNGKLQPYLINGYDGRQHITSYGDDLSILFNDFITKLLSLCKKSILLVYAHNLSGFDGIFLMKHLLKHGEITPLVFNGKIMSIRFKSKCNQTIIFKDSYLMLPLGLRKLCHAFSVKSSKGYFPFLLSNIFYNDILPKIELWTGIPQTEYDLLVAKFTGRVWNFKEESIKYCKLDCEGLYEVLTQFNFLIYNKFKVNMTSCVTLPALAMKIYKTHFMPKDSIFQILGSIESDIRESYTGGAVDVYTPHNKVGVLKNILKKLYYYDVNSLYPTVMAKCLMPMGKPIEFTGNILRFEPDAFGFFYCKITSPTYLEHPILQRRIKTSEGIRTIAGLGTWEGFIFSEEMRNAINYGYQFEVIRGYQFQKGNLFKNYVETMYSLRLQYQKDEPMNLIAKLLMNSLYGKFGMKLEMNRVDIYDISTDEGKDIFKEVLNLYGETISDYVKIDDNLLIIRDSLADVRYDEQLDMYHGMDVNIAIASAITGNARIYMSQFKNNPRLTLYYSDTDSVVIDEILPDLLVGSELGQLKLEHIVERAVFLAPKVYGLVTDKGDQIIKVKGVTKVLIDDLNIDDLESLLVKDSTLEFNQDKWFKRILEGEINIFEVVYTLLYKLSKIMNIQF